MTHGYCLQFLSAPPVTTVPAFYCCRSPVQRGPALRGLQSPSQGAISEISEFRKTGRVLFTVFSDPKTQWDAPADFGPRVPEQVPPAPEVQDADCATSETGCPCGRLVCNSQPQGRIFSNLDFGEPHEVSQICLYCKIFEFCVLPFGILLAPRTFTR